MDSVGPVGTEALEQCGGDLGLFWWELGTENAEDNLHSGGLAHEGSREPASTGTPGTAFLSLPV